MLLAVHLRQYNHEVMVIGSSNGLSGPVERKRKTNINKCIKFHSGEVKVLASKSFVLPILIIIKVYLLLGGLKRNKGGWCKAKGLSGINNLKFQLLE